MLARVHGRAAGLLEWTWTLVEPLNARSMLDAATSAAAKPAEKPFVERRRRLSPAALEVVNQKVARAYSPIVIAGFVRLADFVLLSLVGVTLYVGYVVPLTSFRWGISRRSSVLPSPPWFASSPPTSTRSSSSADSFGR